MTAMVEPCKVAAVMNLRQRVRSLADLSEAVREGLPKSALKATLAQAFTTSADQTAMLYRVIPEATYKRRRELLKPDESERTERLARVIATAYHVWDDEAAARRFLTTAHTQLKGQQPIVIALTELGARQVEELLWKLFYGVAA